MGAMNSASAKERSLVYVIAGKDAALVNTKCDRLLEKITASFGADGSAFIADAAQDAVADILDELRTPPLFAAGRIVVVKEADELISRHRELFERYFDSPCRTSVLILTVRSWPSNTRLYRKLAKTGTLIKVEQPNRRQLPSLLAAYSRQNCGKQLPTSAAETLIELAGEELPVLTGEIDKLAVYAGDRRTITAGDVEALVGHNRLFNAFAIIDEALDGNTAAAIEKLRIMFAEDPSAGYMFVGAFAYCLRRLFNARVMLSRGINRREIVSRLRIWSARDAFFKKLENMQIERIGDALCRLAEADYHIKTGRARPEASAERMVTALAAG